LTTLASRLEGFLNAAVFFLAAVFCALVLFQVLGRYAFGNAIFLASAISNYIFIWFAMLGAALAMKDGLHVAVELMPRIVPQKWRRAAGILAHLLSLAFMCILLYASITALPAAQRNLNPALGISVAWGIAAMPVGAALVAFYIVDAIWNLLRTPLDHGGK
jgi:TRAP-type C4-dicarboxylate transport system permease small subunit